MLNKLIERQAAIQARVEKYAQIREPFEKFLEAGERIDAGFWWNISPSDRKSRHNWGRQAVFDIADGQRVVVRAFTDPTRYEFGWRAGDIHRALIDVRVSLPENPTIARKLELPPVWAILEQLSVVQSLDLDKLGKDLEEIVPLVRALLPQN